MRHAASDYFRKCFGERVLLFRPNKIYPELFEETCTYLMVKLIDKNNYLPEMTGESTDVFTTKIPDENTYNDICAEFFWELQNISKGIMRDEISYVMFLLNIAARDMLNRMIKWYIGVNNDFSVTAGKLGKYYKKYLDERLYDMYKKTYPRAEYSEVWEALNTYLL